MARSIVAQFPPHTTFVDVFGGSAAILLAKDPSPVEVYNDIHSGLVTFWRVLRDPELFPRFERMCQLTPYSREEMEHCRASWQTEPDQVTKAWMFFVAVRQGFVGRDQGTKAPWSYVVGTSRGGRAKSTNLWLNTVEALPEISCRFRDVQVEHRTATRVLAGFDAVNTLFYCDPPYIPDTREASSTQAYTHEMSLADHMALIDQLTRLKGMVVLSGYDHAAYDRLRICGWTRQDFDRVCRGRSYRIDVATTRRTESLWVNPSAQRSMKVAS